MSKSYQNVANEIGRSKFIDVASNGDITELFFSGNPANVPVAGGRRVPMINMGLTVSRQKDVTCDETSCVKAFVGNALKMSYTVAKGDTAAADALLAEAIRVMGVWRTSLKADFGILPPVNSAFPEA